MNIEERIYSVTMTEEELSLFSEFLEQKEFGKESAILGAVSAGSWNAKEAAKYAYEDDPEGYEKNKRKYALRGFLAPTAASYQLERARYLKNKKGYTPKEIKKDIEGSKTTGVALGADLLGVKFTRKPVAIGGRVHGLIHKSLREEERKELNSKVKGRKGESDSDKKNKED